MTYPVRRHLLPRACVAFFAIFFAVYNYSIAQPQDVFPVRQGASAQSLNGAWQFKYIAGSDPGADATFHDPAFADAAAWKTLAVPAHWELHGFAEPKYGRTLVDGTGLYRRTFRVPDAWRGQRVFLRFDGVLYGFDAWVNGTKVGSWASGYNACTFDVTAALNASGDNVIAVQVTTRSKGWEFDTNDCWSLSGIYRDVTLFATPLTYFKDYTVRTTLATDDSARLDISAIASSADAGAQISGKLTSPAGEVVHEFQFPLGANAEGATSFTIPRPLRWTAETPALYSLELALVANGQTLQRINDKIGVRQVTTDGGILKLNGQPIKLHGVDHHDLWPDVGRAATEAHLRRDLVLMKAGNINFIRTSHYPPHPRLIELCDELGIYVMCEVPFGFGDNHLTDPTYKDTLLARARATIMRDKNRPSVVVWSVGNENPITPLQLATGAEVKRLDPTRPICFPTVGSYFARNYEQFPEFVDIYAPHYPVISTLREFAQKLTRPIIATEYAHALGLAADRIQDEWEIMQSSPRIAGGAVWMFQDQGILRTSEKPAEEAAPNPYVWLDAHRYFDTNNLDGMDGIVYSDRTPQVDYWQVRKVYSPVQIAERSAAVKPGANEISLHVENRHDFRALTGFTLGWNLKKNSAVVQSGTRPLRAAPHEVEPVSISFTLPAGAAEDIYSLELRCADGSAAPIYERVIRLDAGTEVARASRLFTSLPTGNISLSAEAASDVHVLHDRFEVRVVRATGFISILDRAGNVLVTNIGPHAGRRFTEAEALRAKTAPIWTGALLTKPADLQIEAAQTSDGVRLRVRGRFARPDTANQFLEGEHTLLVKADGSIELAYDYVPVNATGAFLEAGLALAVPVGASEFRWIGQGPFAGYPGKDRLNEFGVHHLNRDDIRFQGNRREVEVALVTTPAGAGLALSAKSADVAVESNAEGTTLSHNAILSGRGNKGGGPETSFSAGEVKHIAGKFTLLPLGGNWPAVVTRWFGAAGDRVAVEKPYYRSYDQ